MKFFKAVKVLFTMSQDDDPNVPVFEAKGLDNPYIRPSASLWSALTGRERA